MPRAEVIETDLRAEEMAVERDLEGIRSGPHELLAERAIFPPFELVAVLIGDDLGISEVVEVVIKAVVAGRRRGLRRAWPEDLEQVNADEQDGKAAEPGPLRHVTPAAGDDVAGPPGLAEQAPSLPRQQGNEHEAHGSQRPRGPSRRHADGARAAGASNARAAADQRND
jgi:hypothetical protein